MDLVELSEALGAQRYHHEHISTDGERVVVVFRDVQDARQFASSLMVCGVPRRFQNNVVDAKVSFDRVHVGQVLEVLRWT